MKDKIIFTITKPEILSRDFSRFEEMFTSWPELSGEKLRERYNSLTLLVDGYNQDGEELYAIAEVRDYFTELHRRWPWWLFFIHHHEANIAVHYLCILQRLESFKHSGATMCATAFDPNELLSIIKEDFCRMNMLFDQANMSDAENEKRSEQILSLFTATIGGNRNNG